MSSNIGKYNSNGVFAAMGGGGDKKRQEKKAEI
jgi:hypothetical protein